MGAEATCTARFRRKAVSGKARLETEALHFRGGDLRLEIPFKQMKKVTARGGTLTIVGPDGPASFDLGAAAEKWAGKIQHPPSRLQKLGAKPEWRASAIGVDDDAFLEELERAVAHLSIGRVVRESDAIFFGATNAAQLDRIATLKASLTSNGALWVIRPKGRPEISESAVMAAGKAAGLVDVKVVSFSPTHTAEKFVIRLADR
ncbi:MAG: hypothetical protein LAO77_02450 [Acidobacteriia bacterium]|nr:hypothetical protein [Terriglobia bacterium]